MVNLLKQNSSAASADNPFFISYSTKNKRLAFAVVSELESHGFSCWIAQRDIAPGTGNYGSAIITAVSSARLLVLLLTEESNRSQHVVKEVERAVSKKVPILVARLAQVELSKDLEYYVSTAQWLDVAARSPDQQLRKISEAASRFYGQLSQSPAIGLENPKKPKDTPWFIAVAVTLAAVIVFMSLVFAVVRLPAVARSIAKIISPNGRPSLPAPARRTGDNTKSETPPASLSNSFASSHAPADETSPAPQSPTFLDADKHIGPIPSSPAIDSLTTTAQERMNKRESFLRFAREHLPKFHNEAISASSFGSIQPGDVIDQGIYFVASCRLHPNLPAYRRLARSIIDYLDVVTTDRGGFSSDGLKTGPGVDLDVALKRHRRDLLTSSLALPRIFANGRERDTISRATRKDQNEYIGCEKLFNIYSPETTGTALSGLRWLYTTDLFYDFRRSGGVLIILEDTDATFRRTSWRWFHLNDADWSAIFSQLPLFFICEFQLLGADREIIEADNYELKNYGASQEYGRDIRIIAPFFVGDDADYYAPEIILRKPLLVTQSEVGNVKGQSVRITNSTREEGWE